MSPSMIVGGVAAARAIDSTGGAAGVPASRIENRAVPAFRSIAQSSGSTSRPVTVLVPWSPTTTRVRQDSSAEAVPVPETHPLQRRVDQPIRGQAHELDPDRAGADEGAASLHGRLDRLTLDEQPLDREAEDGNLSISARRSRGLPS